MRKREIRCYVHGIEQHSGFELQNWRNVPEKAKRQEQIEALELDRKWHEDHCHEVCQMIDKLVKGMVP